MKIVCVFFGLWSVALVIHGVWRIYSGVHALGTRHAMFSTVRPLLLLIFWGSAIYGVHKKAPIAWKLGWGVIGVGLLTFLAGALSAISKLPRTDYPGVAGAAVVFGGAAVAFYWGFWWSKQKSCFVKSKAMNNTQE